MKPATGNRPQHLFGLAIKRLRLEQGLSQEQLSGRAGIHRNYAGAVERGERNVALVNMVKIAAALGVSLSRLVEGIDKDADFARTPTRRNKPAGKAK